MAKQGVVSEASVVGILVDEALALRIHKKSRFQFPGLRHWQRDGDLVQVTRACAGGHAEPDARAIVAVRRDAH